VYFEKMEMAGSDLLLVISDRGFMESLAKRSKRVR